VNEQPISGARRHVQHHKIKGGFSPKSKSCFVCVANNWLNFLGRLQAAETRPYRFAQLVTDFARYMEQEKGLAPRTILTRCWVAEDFLRRTLHPKRTLHAITIRQVDEVLARTCPPPRGQRTHENGLEDAVLSDIFGEFG